jgi:hypothetical protein
MYGIKQKGRIKAKRWTNACKKFAIRNVRNIKMLNWNEFMRIDEKNEGGSKKASSILKKLKVFFIKWLNLQYMYVFLEDGN